MNELVFTKPYSSLLKRDEALAHYTWLRRVAPPLVLPEVRSVEQDRIDFELIAGRHLQPEDLPTLATHLGDAHGAAWRAELRHARLDEDHQVTGAPAIRNFVTPRCGLLEPSVLSELASGPAAFYKDTNLRNVIVTATGNLVTVDFDSLTLAPFAYDLAKCTVSLAMTYGALPADVLRAALAAYNAAAVRYDRTLGCTDLVAFLAMADAHGLLTAPYLGMHGYNHSWRRPDSTEHARDHY